MRQSTFRSLFSLRAAIVVAVCVGFGPIGLVAGPGSGKPNRTGIAVLIAVVAIAASYVAISVGLSLAGADQRVDQDADRLSNRLDEQQLYRRWLHRSRWTRLIGGLSGILWWALGTVGRGNLLLLGSAGLAAGSLAAENHRFHRYAGERSARFETRRLGTYLGEFERVAMQVAGALAATSLLAALALDRGRRAAPWAAASAVVLGLCLFAQVRVVKRGRPAVSPRLTQADDRLRTLAINRGLAQPATSLALCLLAEAASALEPAVGIGERYVAMLLRLSVLVFLWRNRRLGLRPTSRSQIAVAPA